MIPALATLALVLLVGWGLQRVLGTRLGVGPAAAIPLLGLLGTGLWAVLLALLGIPWNTFTLGGLGIVAFAVGAWTVVRGSTPSPAAPPPPTALVAATLVSAAAALKARLPADGWDFRYIWGLKAKIFAAAGGLDPAWLEWFPNRFFHPHYPPLWPSLLATGTVLGLPVPWAGALLGGVVVLALGGLAWELARGAPRWARAAAALAAAVAPVITASEHAGYAEPVLALAWAAGLLGLARLECDHRGGIPLLTLAALSLPLVKVEGLVLAIALVAGAVVVARRRAVVPGSTLVLSAGAWALFVRVHDILVEPRTLDPVAMWANASGALAWLASNVASHAGLVLLLWALLLPALARRRGIAVAVALWSAGVAAAYLTTMQEIAWQLATSLGRVLAAPLPAVLALAVGIAWDGGEGSLSPAARRASPPSPPAAAG